MCSRRKTKFLPLKRLPQNGVIAVTAPASPPVEVSLNKGVQYLENLGYRIKVGKSCYARHHYVAGTDESRAEELMDFVKDPLVDAIICARGGYGSIRLLEHLDFNLFRRYRKLFIGFSDITALQWSLYAKCGLPTISAGMVATDMANKPLNPQFEEHFWHYMETGKLHYELDHTQSTEETVNGICLSGTLSLVSKLMGSSFFPDTKNSILVLEDVAEMTHKIEGYLMHLNVAGIFDNAGAILLGKFKKAEKEEFSDVPDLTEVFERVFHTCKKPVIRNLNYGHIDEKIPFPVGAPLSLSLGPKSYLESTESIFED